MARITRPQSSSDKEFPSTMSSLYNDQEESIIFCSTLNIKGSIDCFIVISIVHTYTCTIKAEIHNFYLNYHFDM